MSGSAQRIEVTMADQGGAASASAVDARYFSEAATWEHDVVRSVKRSRALAWIAATMMTLVALMALGCLWLLIPLKSFEPYVVEVDKTTGFLEVKRALAPGDLEQSEAVTQMNVVRYLRARETYDPRAVKDNFDLAQLLSTGEAARALVELYSPANTANPARVLARTGTVAITIRSVQFANSRTAIVRFSTLTRTPTNTTESYWTSLVRFRYTHAPMRNEWRFENPLGFQVTDYRRDQEAAPTVSDLPPPSMPMPAPELTPTGATQ